MNDKMNAEELEENNKETLECARYGEPEDLQKLLELGCSANYSNESGNTALHKAAANGELECCRILYSFGAKLLPNHQGNFPIHWAAQNARLESLRFLFDHYPDAVVLAQNSLGRSHTSSCEDKTSMMIHPTCVEYE